MVKRTPKNYDGTHSTTKILGDLLLQFLTQVRRKNCESVKDLLGAWPEIIGAAGAKFTEAIGFDEGLLTVVVRSSTLYSVLCQSERPRLLRLVQGRFPMVQAITFRRG